MTAHDKSAGILVTVGFVAMLVGAIDPLEGSLLIVPGSGLVALGAFLGNGRTLAWIYRLWVFALISFGVAALWLLSMAGGFGEPSGLSIGWAALVLPYLVGWVMGILGTDSPRWVLWLGLGMGFWFLAMAVMMGGMPVASSPEQAASIRAVQLVVGIAGAVTIGGTIVRLGRARTRPKH